MTGRRAKAAAARGDGLSTTAGPRLERRPLVDDQRPVAGDRASVERHGWVVEAGEGGERLAAPLPGWAGDEADASRGEPPAPLPLGLVGEREKVDVGGRLAEAVGGDCYGDRRRLRVGPVLVAGLAVHGAASGGPPSVWRSRYARQSSGWTSVRRPILMTARFPRLISRRIVSSATPAAIATSRIERSRGRAGVSVIAFIP